MRPHATVPRFPERRRLKAISLLKAGMPYRQVARHVDASLSSVIRWHALYQREGREALRQTLAAGRPPFLNESEHERLLEILSAGSLARGYPSESWTLRRIREVIVHDFSVRYSVPGVAKLMHTLGWSCQKPTKQARERNEADIRYWKRHVWPRIKKSRSAWSPFGFFG